jgi:hypothetical protein
MLMGTVGRWTSPPGLKRLGRRGAPVSPRNGEDGILPQRDGGFADAMAATALGGVMERAALQRAAPYAAPHPILRIDL